MEIPLAIDSQNRTIPTSMRSKSFGMHGIYLPARRLGGSWDSTLRKKNQPSAHYRYISPRQQHITNIIASPRLAHCPNSIVIFCVQAAPSTSMEPPASLMSSLMLNISRSSDWPNSPPAKKAIQLTILSKQITLAHLECTSSDGVQIIHM